MSPEEYERIKASEKAHLMEMKRLKGLAAEAGRRGRMAAAIDAVTGSLTAGDDTREAMTRRLMEEAATGEARFEIAIEAQNEAAARAARESGLAAFTERTEADATAARARDTVAQMRAALGMTDSSASSTPGSSGSGASETAAGKTFGRSPEPDPAAPETPPGKTFGRA